MRSTKKGDGSEQEGVRLRDYIRDVPNFPVPGILFRDITPLLKSPVAFREALDRLAHHYANWDLDAIVGIESRGFLFAAPLADRLGKMLIPARKPGKLPPETYKVFHTLEYGSSALELHADALSPGQRVLIVDDLLATGGTLAAAVALVEQAGGRVAGCAVLVELSDLNGKARLKGFDVFSLIRY